ncbi:MAG: hypothetical protein LW689_09220 [Novosphingobium sp.]|nr:hypothetical protein [Novosphingobium sp.]
MAKAWHRADVSAQGTYKPLDWRKRMSDHIAYALLAYTGLQIFVTMGALNAKSGSMLPYFALIVLVAGSLLSPRSQLGLGPGAGLAFRGDRRVQAAGNRLQLIALLPSNT